MADTKIYQGKRIDLILRTVPLTDGGTATKEIVVHPGAAVMIPLLDGNRVVMVRNHRWSINEKLLELPAGTLDKGEEPETTARRELEEETGFKSGRIRKVAEFYPSPGILTELMHLFVAEELTPGQQHLDQTENLEPVIMNWNDAVNMALRGEIKDGKTLVGLLLWERKRQGS